MSNEQWEEFRRESVAKADKALQGDYETAFNDNWAERLALASCAAFSPLVSDLRPESSIAHC
jgi:hypothetical protein